MLSRTRTAVAVGVAVLAVLCTAPTALADDPGGDVECGKFSCRVEADSPGQTGRTDSASAGSAPQGSGGSGTSSSPWTCTYKPLSPQPPADSLDWEGHKPGDGAVYTQTCHYLDSPDSVVRRQWLANPPPEAATVDPTVLAQRAVDSMKLAGPDIASPRPAGKYLVGMPMWMWVNQSRTTYGPNTASASAGGVSVTATAKVTKIVWQMGDGTAVTCAGPGTPYTAAAGKSDSPTCGHTYTRTSADQPDGRYQVTTTSTWTINWQVTTGGGAQAGQLTETRQSQILVPLVELQVLN
ncbi:ATP/GTP-binding protein [Streptomyces sp. NPDC087903]|uniref:ATP/GTP-binding protein n=1 Tax=Streptomyces sp. NPDC087903 TaxID=3365819 RepID=UPI003803B6DD